MISRIAALQRNRCSSAKTTSKRRHAEDNSATFGHDTLGSSGNMLAAPAIADSPDGKTQAQVPYKAKTDPCHHAHAKDVKFGKSGRRLSRCVEPQEGQVEAPPSPRKARCLKKQVHMVNVLNHNDDKKPGPCKSASRSYWSEVQPSYGIGKKAGREDDKPS